MDDETLVRDLAGGDSLGQQRNLVLIGGTGTGKSHTGKSHTGKSHTGKPHTGKPHTGKSHTGKPHTGKPHTGKSHLAVGIARACIRSGGRGRFFDDGDLVDKLDAEARAGRQVRTADLPCRLDFVILDEPGYLPFAQTGSPRPADSCHST